MKKTLIAVLPIIAIAVILSAVCIQLQGKANDQAAVIEDLISQKADLHYLWEREVRDSVVHEALKGHDQVILALTYAAHFSKENIPVIIVQGNYFTTRAADVTEAKEEFFAIIDNPNWDIHRFYAMDSFNNRPPDTTFGFSLIVSYEIPWRRHN